VAGWIQLWLSCGGVPFLDEMADQGDSLVLVHGEGNGVAIGLAVPVEMLGQSVAG
jgi:hypothetical protein